MARLKYSNANQYSSALEEQILLDKLIKGEQTAFWQLWELYRDYLYYRCLNWMGGNHFDAEEVMSFASIKAWHKLPNYAHNITNLKGWFNRFVHNLCVDIHRQRSRGALGTENIDNLSSNNYTIESSNSYSPESTLLQQELKIYLRYCIEDLPLRLRQPVVMFYYQEMSYADIAKKLIISQDNLGKRLQQARQILKTQLKQYHCGLDTKTIGKDRFEQLKQQDFSAPINTNVSTKEISEGTTALCLENIPPVWCNFH